MRQIGSFENVTELFFVAETTQNGDAIPPKVEGNLCETFLVIYLCGLKSLNVNVNFLGMACT